MHSRLIELVVRGRLSPELLLVLDDFDVETDGAGLTRVVGRVADQPRLFGMLDLFDELHIEIVSMNPVKGSVET